MGKIHVRAQDEKIQYRPYPSATEFSELNQILALHDTSHQIHPIQLKNKLNMVNMRNDHLYIITSSF